MKIILVTLLLIAISIGLAATVDSIGTLNFRGPFFVPNTRPEISRFVWFSIEMHGLINSNEQRLIVQNNQNWINSIPQHTQTYLQDGWYLYEIKIYWSPNTTINNRESQFSVYLQNIEDGIWYDYLHVHSDYVFQFAQSQTCQYLQDSIDNAPDNSTIEIQYGNYYGSVVIDGRSGLTLIGEQNNGENPNLIGVGYESIITITNSDDITVRNLNIRNGHNDIGAGVYIEGLPVSDPDYPSIINFNNCVISNNRAIDLFSGGMPIYNSTGGALNILQAEVSIYCSILHSNRAYLWPTAHIHDGSICFESTTIDQTDESVGIGGNTTQLQSFINCAVAFPNDSYNYIYDFSCLYHTELTSQYFEGFANFIDDPMFVDAANGDYHLQKGSPCIGAGFFDAYCDYNGNPGNQNLITPHDETQDIGALPFDGDRIIIYAFDDDPQGNWMCFPILDDFSYLNIGGVPYRADNIRAFFYDYEGQNSVMDQVQFRWYNTGNVYGTNTHLPDQVITWHYMAGENSDEGFLGYKAIFNSPSVMDTYHGYHIPLDRFVQIPEHTVENWIGYFLPETQTPQAAFGSYLDELHYIQHKDWTMARTMVKRGAPWVAIGDTVTLSYGDMVIVKRFAPPSIEMFQWTRGFHTSKYVREIPEYFEFNKEPEYTAVFVHMDSLTTAQEIAIMSDAQCYGAAVVNGDTVMIQAFISSLPEGSELELVAWDGAKSSANSIPIKLYDQANDTYVHCSSFIKDTSDHYLIKTGSTFDDTEVPPTLTLGIRNYPNPFNPSTTISYSVPDNGDVTITIYNAKGQLVNTLVNEYKNKGNYQVIWNGRDIKGNSVASGLYFTRLVSGGETVKNKMLLMK